MTEDTFYVKSKGYLRSERSCEVQGLRFISGLVFVLVLLSLFTSGCTSTPTYSQFRLSAPFIEPGKGRVYFYRKSYTGRKLEPKVSIDGQTIGVARAGKFFFVDLDTGIHKIEFKTSGKRRLEFEVKAAEYHFIRFTHRAGMFFGDLTPHMVPRVKAEQEMMGLRRYDPSKKSIIKFSDLRNIQPEVQSNEEGSS